jgi:hypothetical protein
MRSAKARGIKGGARSEAKSVTVNGASNTGFDAAKAIVRLKPATEALHMTAEY